MADHKNVLIAIAATTDPAKLRNFRANARRLSATDVEEAAFRRLVEILPKEEPGTLEHDFWKTIHAFEEMHSEERGKTIRLSRTRQKVARVGVKETLIGFATSKTPTDGFRILIDYGCPELTGEALVLKHSKEFNPEVQLAARRRLEDAGVDPSKLVL
ncbi:hypothetical protein [Loktanella sp. M215]|uniref:hypothetical protein n=1 Tax=Loktanella sp. M215 TaxID=2675431 RepID=UPI001F48F14C|nr:hypothetical protein [Loktanella sp. M215]MCF7701482.1 hypothetical protein [Loktanella sp. M215]MCF7701514.1 hypothetical protein [Loktanella sp. M215]